MDARAVVLQSVALKSSVEVLIFYLTYTGASEARGSGIASEGA